MSVPAIAIVVSAGIGLLGIVMTGVGLIIAVFNAAHRIRTESALAIKESASDVKLHLASQISELRADIKLLNDRIHVQDVASAQQQTEIDAIKAPP